MIKRFHHRAGSGNKYFPLINSTSFRGSSSLLLAQRSMTSIQVIIFINSLKQHDSQYSSGGNPQQGVSLKLSDWHDPKSTSRKRWRLLLTCSNKNTPTCLPDSRCRLLFCWSERTVKALRWLSPFKRLKGGSAQCEWWRRERLPSAQFVSKSCSGRDDTDDTNTVEPKSFHYIEFQGQVANPRRPSIKKGLCRIVTVQSKGAFNVS